MDANVVIIHLHNSFNLKVNILDIHESKTDHQMQLCSRLLLRVRGQEFPPGTTMTPPATLKGNKKKNNKMRFQPLTGSFWVLKKICKNRRLGNRVRKAVLGYN